MKVPNLSKLLNSMMIKAKQQAVKLSWKFL